LRGLGLVVIRWGRRTSRARHTIFFTRGNDVAVRCHIVQLAESRRRGCVVITGLE